MADICMCAGTNCPYKESCYRFTAKASEYQTYFVNVPLDGDKCDYYWGKDYRNVWKQKTIEEYEKENKN